MSIFAQRLRLAMDNAGMTQSDLAGKAGAPKSAISQYLAGKNVPGRERILVLADATGVPPDFLTGEEDTPETKVPLPGKKISTAAAARCLGKSRQFVRVGLQRGLLPFGGAVPGTGDKFIYYINPMKFREFVGVEQFNEFFGLAQNENILKEVNV